MWPVNSVIHRQGYKTSLPGTRSLYHCDTNNWRTEGLLAEIEIKPYDVALTYRRRFISVR